ncbi:MAG: hypothetical protein K8L97_19475 [Anaerolineae bacterium]|nr:hypothetical protein [Anaerolineae bacterium]
MPGISLVFNLAGELRKSAIVQSLGETLYFPSNFQETLHDSPSCFVGCVRYEDYPVTTFENDSFQIILEGRIYDKPLEQVQSELYELAHLIFGSNPRDRLVNWLFHTDGEFVIVIYDKRSNRIALFNDILGRLQLYFHQTQNEILISRDIRFLANLLPLRQFDRMALAQYLLLGFPFGRRTLFENVDLLPPASFILASPHKFQHEQIYSFNFDHKENRTKTIHQNAEAMVSIFYEATRNRTNPQHTNVLSLSGGRDSRSIGAALHNLNLPFITASFLDYYRVAKSDVELAEQTAKLFNAEWRVSELGPTTGEETFKLLKIKGGLCGLRLCDILVFFEAIKQYSDQPIYYFTGDGGGKISDQRAARHLTDTHDLVQFVTSRHQRASLDTASALTGVPKREIVDELYECFEAYPEKDTNQKHVHYLIYERAPKFAFESEDRNRCYFWSMAPFYSIHFFNYVMHCPDDQKANYALYSEFMSRLSPSAAALTEQNVGLPITSKRYRLKHGVKRMLMGAVSRSPRLVRYAKNVIGRTNPYAPDHLIIQCIMDQLRNSPSVSNYLSAPAVHNMLSNLQQYSKEEFQLLLTITSAIESFEEPHTTLEQYWNKQII